jgi:hypothetical protein
VCFMLPRRTSGMAACNYDIKHIMGRKHVTDRHVVPTTIQAYPQTH